ncbi:hypothetical protein GQ457_17G015740 [Hibiscus cannabinus]
MNVDQSTLLEWANSIGFSTGSLPTDYLGLPLGVRQNLRSLWDPILQKLSSKLATWKSQLLSFGGRITLVKSVLSSLPIFFMSLFRMPAMVAKRITCMVSNFLWGGAVDQKRIHWVKWSLLCQPVAKGGLGLTDFQLQNRCLLAKWIWRFSAENESLWNMVILCKHKKAGSALSPPLISKHSSWVWKGILNSTLSDDAFGNLFQNNLALRVGDGRHIRFWSDIWVCEVPLSVKFPRIFALALNKSGVIVDFGVRRGDSWSWTIHLRRRLFDWEISLWNTFFAMISSFQTSGLGRDWVQWMGSSEGIFSTKAMKALICANSVSQVNWKKVVWIGLAPPKVEAFVWLLLHNRAPVKVELLKRGVRSIGDDICPLCSRSRETVDHLFFTCIVSWQIWSLVANYWGVSLVLHQDPLSFLLSWPHICSKLAEDRMWRLLPYAIIWSLWLHRNDIIFQGKTIDVAQLFFSVKTRAAWWWKALSADSNIHLDSLICDPSLASLKAYAYPSSHAIVVWTPPPCGFLKFNVDGACSKEGLCGVGGVLRDPPGSILLEFSQSIGAGSVLLAEILAIKIVVERFVNSPWVKRWRLIVESDSKSVVEWISTPSVANPLFRQLVGSIYTFFRMVVGLSGIFEEN